MYVLIKFTIKIIKVLMMYLKISKFFIENLKTYKFSNYYIQFIWLAFLIKENDHVSFSRNFASFSHLIEWF